MAVQIATAERSSYGSLRRLAQAASMVPGMRPTVRHLLRQACQGSSLSQQHKQQLHNLLAIAAAPEGTAQFSVHVDSARRVSVRTPVRDDLTRYWYFWGYTHYEVATIALLKRLLPHKQVFVDVGANLGYYTLLAAALLDGRGAVHAFEPWPEVFEQLHTNVALNGFDTVRVSRVALSDSDGQARLFVPSGQEWTTASLIQDFMPADQYECVTTERFDTYCARNGVDGVDLIKIDVEGAELQVLQGMGDVLERSRPDIILEVLDPYADSLEQFFAGTAYRKFRIRSAGLEEIPRISAEPHDRNVFLSCNQP